MANSSPGVPITPASSLHTPGRLDPTAVLRIGAGNSPHTDLYHYLLGAPWSRVLAAIGGFYLGINCLFAVLYLVGGDCITGATPGSFTDAFFFSVQTFSTIGYGVMAPKNVYASVLVTLEALIGLLGVAMATGLMFSKFSRPTARVLFSDRMIVTRRDGKPCLVLRMANARGNDIIEASLRVSVLKPEITAEGEKLRRVHDLKLARNQTPLFTLTWMAFHEIEADSPLFGETEESVNEKKLRFIVTLTGLDGTFAQTIHARKIYEWDHLVWGARFADALSNLPDGRLVVDYTKFHETEPLPAPVSTSKGSAAA